MAGAGQPATGEPTGAMDAALDAAQWPQQRPNGGAPHARPGAAAVLLAGAASRLSRAFAAGAVPPQLALDHSRIFPGAVSISVAVPLGAGGDSAILALHARIGGNGSNSNDGGDAARQSGLCLLPAAATAAGRCVASTSVVHAFLPAEGVGDQLADLTQHSEAHGAASLLLLPIPALQPRSASGGAGSQPTADQPFRAVGAFGIGLGPGTLARRALIARAAYVAMALARTLGPDLATLQQEAAAVAAAGLPAAAAMSFQPAAPAANGGSPAMAADAAAEAADTAAAARPTDATALHRSADVGEEDLDASDAERETEAAVAPYMARLSPPGPPPLQPASGAAEGSPGQPLMPMLGLPATPSAAATAAAGADPSQPQAAAAASADPAPGPQPPTTRAAARRRRQPQQAAQQRQPEGQQQGVEPAAAPSATVSAPQPSSAAAAELMPWAKAEALFARNELQPAAAGAMSAATLRFASPRLEAGFGVAHAAFLMRWVDPIAMLLAFVYLVGGLLAPTWTAGLGTGPLLLPAVATAGAAAWRLAEPDRYLQRREWALTAVRLAWLLHFAGADAPTGNSAAVAAAPASLADAARLLHLACADVLLVLSLLFPVQLQSLLLLSSASAALVVAGAPLRACVLSDGGQPQAACVVRLLAAALLFGTAVPAGVTYVAERAARRRWLRRRPEIVGEAQAQLAGLAPASVA